MRGVILAAGRGSRLGPLTADRPKGMVAVAGRPLIAWQMAALAEAGVDELAVVRGYRAEAVAAPGCPSARQPALGGDQHGRSLIAAADWLAEGGADVTAPVRAHNTRLTAGRFAEFARRVNDVADGRRLGLKAVTHIGSGDPSLHKRFFDLSSSPRSPTDPLPAAGRG